MTQPPSSVAPSSTSSSTSVLGSLGLTPFFSEQLDDLEPAHRHLARVVAEHRDACVLCDGGEPFLARPSGRLRHQEDGSDRPAVGDWVTVHRPPGGGTSIIERVLRRTSQLIRRAAGKVTRSQVLAANVDTVLVVTALDGDFSPRRLERYLSLVWESGARPAIILTKVDLCSEPAPFVRRAEAAGPGVPIEVVSAKTGEGIEAVRDYATPGQTIAFVGSSGVGKSTLINRLLGHEQQRTMPIRASDGRGRHATTGRSLLPLPQGGLLIDTPGMRELQLWDASEGLRAAFTDVEALAVDCGFRDCRHENEPGCAVQRAVESGALAAERLASYHKLGRELDHEARKRDDAARANSKRRWKAISRQIRSIKTLKSGQGPLD